MGMYDTVYIKCPSCDKENECQTKSGDCILSSYSLYSAPMNVLAGVIGKDWCEHCKQPFIVELIHKPICIVRKLTKDEEE